MTRALALVLLLATAGIAHAEDDAFGAYQRGYYREALSGALARLEKNPKDGAAQTLVGTIYAEGVGVKRDQASAANWFRLGAANGDANAAFALDMMLVQGAGVPRDQPQALTYLQQAAAVGHPGALYNLGVTRLESEPPDFAGAAKLFRQAADKGELDAFYALGVLAKEGRGEPKNPEKAAALFGEGAAQRHINSMIERALMLFNGEGVAKDEAGAFALLRVAAWRGNPIAMNRVARLYAVGRGTAKDVVEAARWHMLAKGAGLNDAMLDDVVSHLTQEERVRMDGLIRKQLADQQPGGLMD